MPQPAVVLVRPREEGNVGATARAMANLGLDHLLLVEPAAELGGTALAFAVGGRPLLTASTRHPSLAAALAPFRRVIATTSARDRRMAVPQLTARELPAFLAQDPPGTPAALVFGSEVGGLNNDELALAHAVVTIPCAPELPTLNLAQSVVIVAYELFQARGSAPAFSPEVEPPAAAAEVDGLFEHAGAVLGAIGFQRDSSYAGVLQDLRRIAARAALSSHDVRILRGICRRAERALERAEREEPER